MLVKKEIKIDSRKNLALYKEHLQRKRVETRDEAADQIGYMQEYWTPGRILRDVTRSSYLPLIAEGLFGFVLAYTTKSYKNTAFLKSAMSGITGLFRKSGKEAEEDTPHTDL